MNKLKSLNKFTLTNIKSYGLVIIAFAILFPLQSAGLISNSISGQLVPICTYVVMAISLTLTVGFLGELALRGVQEDHPFLLKRDARASLFSIPSAALRALPSREDTARQARRTRGSGHGGGCAPARGRQHSRWPRADTASAARKSRGRSSRCRSRSACARR